MNFSLNKKSAFFKTLFMIFLALIMKVRHLVSLLALTFLLSQLKFPDRPMWFFQPCFELSSLLSWFCQHQLFLLFLLLLFHPLLPVPRCGYEIERCVFHCDQIQ